jgi:hypothetical protein
MLFNGISEAHRAQILSCFGPRVGAWFIARLIFSTFRLSSLVFSTTLRTRLGLPRPSIKSILQFVCTHPIDPMGIQLLCCTHGNERIGTQMQFAYLCHHWAKSWLPHGTRAITCISFNHIQLLLLTN